MAEVTVYKGDVILSEIHKGEYTLMTLPKVELLLAQPISGKYATKVIDASICDGDSAFFKAAIERTIYPLIVIFPDGKVPFKKAEFKTKNKVTMLEGTIKEKADLFGLINTVLCEKDRNKVFEALMETKNKTLHHVLFLYLADNIAYFPNNLGVLSFIDMIALHKDTQRFAELLAFSFTPVYRKLFLKWRRPKKEE